MLVVVFITLLDFGLWWGGGGLGGGVGGLLGEGSEVNTPLIGQMDSALIGGGR